MKPRKIGSSQGIAQLLYEAHLDNEPRYHRLLARVLNEIAHGIPDDDSRYRIHAVKGLLFGSFEWLEPIYGSPALELESRLRYLDDILQELRKHVQPIHQQEMLDDAS